MAPCLSARNPACDRASCGAAQSAPGSTCTFFPCVSGDTFFSPMQRGLKAGNKEWEETGSPLGRDVQVEIAYWPARLSRCYWQSNHMTIVEVAETTHAACVVSCVLLGMAFYMHYSRVSSQMFSEVVVIVSVLQMRKSRFSQL